MFCVVCLCGFVVMLGVVCCVFGVAYFVLFVRVVLCWCVMLVVFGLLCVVCAFCG